MSRKGSLTVTGVLWLAMTQLGFSSLAHSQVSGRVTPGPVEERVGVIAAEPPKLTPLEEMVSRRAQERWDAARQGNFEKSYAYTLPSYRAVTPFKLFRAGKTGEATLLSAKVVGAKCEEAVCYVRVGIEFLSPFMAMQGQTMQTYFDERWTLEDNQWWLYLQ